MATKIKIAISLEFKLQESAQTLQLVSTVHSNKYDKFISK